VVAVTKAQKIEVTIRVKKTFSKIDPGAGDQLVSQLMRTYRLHMLSLANGQQTGTRGCWRKKKKQMSSNLNKHLRCAQSSFLDGST